MKNILILASVSMIMVWSGCTSHTPATKKEDHTGKTSVQLVASQVQNLQFDTVKYVNESDELVVVGEISFDEDNIIRIYPIVSGTVDAIYVSLGDYVKKGQLLATIISTDMNQYQMDFNIAKSNLALSEKQYRRVQELYKSDFASERELNEAETDYKNALLDYEGKKQVLELYGGSPEKNDAVFKVYSPISGYIVERNINEGTQIRTDNSENMFIISDLKSVWVWANVYESDIARVHVGDQAEVNAIAYPNQMFYGEINKIGSTLDPEARVVKVRIDLENPGELLKPEMFVTVVLRSKLQGQILAVPTSSIFIENNINKVIVQESDFLFRKAEITEGKTSKSYTEVKNGLKPGEIVVSKGGLFVSAAINNQ